MSPRCRVREDGPRPRRGFTLMEVIVSTTVLAVASLLVFNLFPTSFLAIHTAGARIEAQDLASSILEQRRSLAFSQFQAGTVETLKPVVTASHTRLCPSLATRAVSGVDPSRLVELDATVAWSDPSGHHKVEMSCYVLHIQ